MHTDDIRAARDADGDGRRRAFDSLIRGQVECKANKRFSGWSQQHRIPQRTDFIKSVDQLKIMFALLSKADAGVQNNLRLLDPGLFRNVYARE